MSDEEVMEKKLELQMLTPLYRRRFALCSCSSCKCREDAMSDEEVMEKKPLTSHAGSLTPLYHVFWLLP